MRYDGGEHGHIMPGLDGRVICTKNGAIRNQMTGLTAMAFKYGFSIPDVHGDYFLALTFGHGIRFDAFGAWKRIFLIPQAKVVVLFSNAIDRLELRRLDVDALLENSDLDYVLITSRVTSRAPGRNGRHAEGVARMARPRRLPRRHR